MPNGEPASIRTLGGCTQGHEPRAGLVEDVRPCRPLRGPRLGDVLDVGVGPGAVVVPFGGHHDPGRRRNLDVTHQFDGLAKCHVGTGAAVDRQA